MYTFCFCLCCGFHSPIDTIFAHLYFTDCFCSALNWHGLVSYTKTTLEKRRSLCYVNSMPQFLRAKAKDRWDQHVAIGNSEIRILFVCFVLGFVVFVFCCLFSCLFLCVLIRPSPLLPFMVVLSRSLITYFPTVSGALGTRKQTLFFFCFCFFATPFLVLHT